MPHDRRLPVPASPIDGDDVLGRTGSAISGRMSDAPTESSVPLGASASTVARVLFGDANALGVRQHDEPVDGSADAAFRGPAAEATAVFAAPGTGRTRRGRCTRLGRLTVDDAMEQARAVLGAGLGRAGLGWKEETGKPLVVDFRPHEHGALRADAMCSGRCAHVCSRATGGVRRSHHAGHEADARGAEPGGGRRDTRAVRRPPARRADARPYHRREAAPGR